MMILYTALRNSIALPRVISSKKLLSSLLVSDSSVIKALTPEQPLILRNLNTLVFNTNALHPLTSSPQLIHKIFMSSSNKPEEKSENASCDPSAQPAPAELTMKQKLKFAVRDYGATVIVFHVGISLISLGIFYLAASSGLDVSGMVQSVGFDSPVTAATVGNAGTFVVAYAIHKCFAPVRITITLTTAPFIVRYLRKKGILKIKPKSPK